MALFLLLVVVSAIVLVPPAIRFHASRREAFLLSFGRPPVVDPPAPRLRSPRIQRRRRIAGGLLLAMAATLVVGLLPPFRVFLVVHLFLLDAFLAYVALLAHMANRAAGPLLRQTSRAPEAVGSADQLGARRGPVPGVGILSDLGPVAAAG